MEDPDILNVSVILSAILICLIFPKTNLFFLAYICLIPLLWSLEKSNSYQSALTKGFLFGFVFQAYFHSWILELHAFAPWYGVLALWISYSFYLSLFYAAIGGCYHFFRQASSKNQRFKSITPYLFPAIWIVFEWLRSLGSIGNTAGSLGFSQTHFLPILQIASILGVYGISFYIVYVNVFLFVLWKNRKIEKKALLIIGLLLLPLIWGLIQLKTEPKQTSKPYLIAIIQGNHSQSEKQDFSTWRKIKEDYMELSMKAAQKKPSLIFWPETFVPELNLRNPIFMERLRLFTKNYHTTIIFGSPTDHAGKYYNSVIGISENGLNPIHYSKHKLMPFGEYIPFRNLLEKRKIHIEGIDYSQAKSFPLINIKKFHLGGGICLESIYPTHYRYMTQKGANLLYVLVNNAWFFNSSAAEEHLQMSIMRAVENNRYLIQSANTGISAIIDPKGRILDQSALDKKKIITGNVFINLPNSFYNIIGDSIVYMCLLGLLLYYLYIWKKK